MSNTNCLVVTFGFFGDIIFATSLAEKLKGEGYSQVDYLIGFPQVAQLVENNPFIDRVFISQIPGPKPYHPCTGNNYSKVIELGALDYQITPCEQYQQQAGFEELSSGYVVYTTPEYDAIARDVVVELRQTGNKPVLAFMTNWQPKTYLFTPEQYEAGVDVPNLGYGGAHRDIQYIVNELQEHFTLYPIGVGDANQQQTLYLPDDDQKSLLFEASIMKHCVAFIGTDGGLATIAAGVGTKTVITGDFNLQLYGWNGVLKQIKQPRLGPREYFGDPHTVLDAYLADKEVANHIINLLS
jgi:hypothetical protein